MTSAIATMAIALVACGRADNSAGTSGSAVAVKPAVTIDVAAVNALVPAALQTRLVFDKRDLVIERGKHKTTYTIAAPAGWRTDSKMFAHLRTDDKPGLLPRFEVGSNCDGECTPKPWQAIADRVNFALRAKAKVVKDDKTPGRRTMIAEVDGGARTDVVVAWWTDGDRNYHTCTASLDEALKDAAPAFDRACQAVAIDGDD